LSLTSRFVASCDAVTHPVIDTRTLTAVIAIPPIRWSRLRCPCPRALP